MKGSAAFSVVSLGAAAAVAAIVGCAGVAMAGWSSSSGGGDSGSSKDAKAIMKTFQRPAALPAGAAATPAQVALGKALFFDKRLAKNQDMSCAFCHMPDKGWTDGKVWPEEGIAPHVARRTQPTVNLAFFSAYFWDGAARTLENAVQAVVASPHFMNMAADQVDARLQAVPGYKPLFAAAYPGEPVAMATAAKALAAFERSLVSGTAPFDDWIGGKDDAIGADAKRGFAIFTGKAWCADCHSGWLFSDQGFRDIGLPGAGSDPGRGKYQPKATVAQHAFATAQLRDVAIHPPYMHDGSLKTLEEVVDFYASGGQDRPSRSEDVKPFKISADEKKDLVAFLRTLTSRPAPFQPPALP